MLLLWTSKFGLMVDHATRFCTAEFITNKNSATIVKALFNKWITFFGAPKQLMSDNGCEFNNELMRSLGDGFDIKITCTAAESP